LVTEEMRSILKKRKWITKIPIAAYREMLPASRVEEKYGVKS